MTYFWSIFLAILLVEGCALVQEKNEDVVMFNADQTNGVAGIISVEEAREKVIQDIIRHGYDLPDGMILSNPQTAYLKDVQWGPVVFVENLKENDIDPKYYYLFYGQMPDGSVPAVEAVDAKTGKVFMGGVMDYYENRKPFLLSPEEARSYVAKKLNLDTNQIMIKAVFFREWTTPSPIECWKYEVRLRGNTPIHTRSLTTEAIYVDPTIMGPSREEPNPTNTGSLLGGRRLSILSVSAPSLPGLTKTMEEDGSLHFYPIE